MRLETEDVVLCGRHQSHRDQFSRLHAHSNRSARRCRAARPARRRVRKDFGPTVRARPFRFRFSWRAPMNSISSPLLFSQSSSFLPLSDHPASTAPLLSIYSARPHDHARIRQEGQGGRRRHRRDGRHRQPGTSGQMEAILALTHDSFYTHTHKRNIFSSRESAMFFLYLKNLILFCLSIYTYFFMPICI